MGKVDLIKDRCIGCGACMSVAPDNFTFGDDGRAELINSEISEAAIEASETCPVSAIIVENECSCSEECNCKEEDNCECNCNSECSCGDNCECTEETNCGCNCNCK